MRMHNPPHPGELLRELWLEPLKLTITSVAERLNVSRKAISELVNEHTALSTDMAIRLELAFGKSAESWLAHQTAYDLWQKQGDKKALNIEAFEMA
jgi:addiction module HigA family antidote